MARVLPYLLACSTVSASLLLAPAAAVAAPPHDSATGSGKITGRTGAASDFSLAAHSGPQGEDPQGNVNLRNIDFPGAGDKGKGHVLCVLVIGNEAAVVAEFKNGGPFPGFPFAAVYVQDNGQPSGDTPDRGLAFGINIPSCADTMAIGQEFAQPLVQGNVVVRDAT